MHFYYSDTFNIPLPEKHRFPGQKYAMLREKLLVRGILNKDQLIESPLASKEDLLTVHAESYIDEFFTGKLDPKKMRRIGFPWSEFLVRRTQATVGGAIASAEAALDNGLSGQLAGGTHHAHYDYGAGYCIFNDFAVAALKLMATGQVARVAIVDLDVHQGDGNASLLAEHPRVFVLSLHGEKNFPFRKFKSDLDIGLPDQCDDATYLEHLHEGLGQVRAFAPDLILYQAGVDVLETDRLGRMKITLDGLRQRDEMVFNLALSAGTPLSMGIGGGYGDPIDSTVEGYVQTYEVAKKLYRF